MSVSPSDNAAKVGEMPTCNFGSATTVAARLIGTILKVALYLAIIRKPYYTEQNSSTNLTSVAGNADHPSTLEKADSLCYDRYKIGRLYHSTFTALDT
jgi:hypothetical protein